MKRFALGTAASMVGGKMWNAPVLGEVNAYGEPIGRIPIRLSEYPALLDQFGSVRFAFMDPAMGLFPFSLNRADETTFYAVDTRCAHAGCVVEAWNSAEFAMSCYCHGSQYDIMGRVIREPATSDLMTYTATFDGIDTVTVIVPGIDMSITKVMKVQQSGADVKVRLDFAALPTGRYRVMFQQNLGDPPQQMLLSTTPNGTPNLTEVSPLGNSQTVYVVAPLPRGFFTVELIVYAY